MAYPPTGPPVDGSQLVWNGAQWVAPGMPTPLPATYPGYGYAAYDGYVPAHQRATVARWLLVGNLVFIGLTVFGSILEAANPALVANDSDPGQLAVLGLFEGLVALGAFATQVAFIIAFLMWVFTAYRNMSALRMPGRFTPGWAVGWWFIPFASLVQAPRVMLDLWRETRQPPAVVWTWYGLWVGSSIVAVVGALSGAGSLSAVGRTTDSVVWSAMLHIASSAMTMLAGVTLFSVIRQVQAGQEAHARAAGADSPAPPAYWVPSA